MAYHILIRVVINIRESLITLLIDSDIFSGEINFLIAQFAISLSWRVTSLEICRRLSRGRDGDSLQGSLSDSKCLPSSSPLSACQPALLSIPVDERERRLLRQALFHTTIIIRSTIRREYIIVTGERKTFCPPTTRRDNHNSTRRRGEPTD